MEPAKRIKLNTEPIDFSNINDIVVLDPLSWDSASGDEIENPTISLGADEDNLDDDEQTTEDLAEDLKTLLSEWGASSLLDYFIGCGVTFERLGSLEEMDYYLLLKKLIKKDFEKYGDFVDFRKFHRNWKIEEESRQQGRSNDVLYILENGGKKADDIRKFYELNNFLIDPLREDLVDLILQEKRQIPRKILDQIACQICTIFPTEQKFVYYEKLKNKEPTGLLYRKYSASRETKKNKRQSQSEKSKAEEAKVAKEAKDKQLDVLLTEEVKESINFLNNKDNFVGKIDRSTIIQHWKSSFPYRDAKLYKDFAEALDEWLPLRRVDGPALIHTDFDLKYGSESAHSFLKKWSPFVFRNQNELLKGIRDAKQKKMVLAAQCGNDENEKNKIILMALHHLTFTVPGPSAKTAVQWTPTIAQSKDAFLIELNNSTEIAGRLKFQYRLCELKQFKIHPIIFVIKRSNETRYVVVLGNMEYESESLVDAIDDAFKMYVIFKIPFPPQCVRVWLFINALFYQVELDQKPNAKMTSMLNSFKI